MTATIALGQRLLDPVEIEETRIREEDDRAVLEFVAAGRRCSDQPLRKHPIDPLGRRV